jgi:hypothetical protein
MQEDEADWEARLRDSADSPENDRITTGMFPIAVPGATPVHSPIVSPMLLARDYRKRCLRVHSYCERSCLLDRACLRPPAWDKRFHAIPAHIGYHGPCLLHPSGSIQRILFRGDFALHRSRVRLICV